MLITRLLVASLALVSPVATDAQHYCWPCAELHGVIGKWTTAASNAPAIFDWYLRYLNNVVEGANNTGDGTHSYYKVAWQTEIIESWDVAPNVMALEVNECGGFIGDYLDNVTEPMTGEQKELVESGQRLQTGALHECPCAVQGRAHITNGSVSPDVLDWGSVETAWGSTYTAAAQAQAESDYQDAVSTMSPEEASAYSTANVFGLHAVDCPFHESGPCLLRDVEEGVRRAWGVDTANFSSYVPLMDNSLMLWVASLGPTLDALVGNGEPFYPMVWNASTASPSGGVEVFSVLASPGGKVLVEVASLDPGGRSREQFHSMPHARAVLANGTHGGGPISNEPLDAADAAARPLSPLRISRAVGASRFEETLAFYGVGSSEGSTGHAADLGFGLARRLLDETFENGDRAVTILLSPNATVHLQLWSRAEPSMADDDLAPFPSDEEFASAVGSNQVNGGQPASSASFCASGSWDVARYNDYVLKTHETVMTPVPVAADDDDAAAAELFLHPPAGNSFDVFVDDHLSWDCTSPSECDKASGGAALYALGRRVQWLGGKEDGWTAYSYDPAGFGFEMHWFAAPAGFEPSGIAHPDCFGSFPNGTCSGSIAPV